MAHLGAVALLLVATPSAAARRVFDAHRQEALAGTLSFQNFVTDFGRGYEEGSDEYGMRRELYELRAGAVREHNQGAGRSWHKSINHMSDWTFAELSSLRGRRSWGGRSGSAGASLLQLGRAVAVNASALPASVEWGHLESLKDVADQGGCGSCWAVASSVMLGARYEVANNKADRTFSAQEIVDCTPNKHLCGGTGGCGGATVELAMEYVEKHGVADHSARPYKGVDTKVGCPSEEGASSYLQRASGHGHGSGLGGAALGMTSWAKLPVNEQAPLMQALLDGPVGVSASAGEWHAYGKGVFSGCSVDATVDHAVVAIGYGEDSEEGKFWQIRNSWGPGWGEHGDIRVRRQDSDVWNQSEQKEKGHCGTDYHPKEGTACQPYPKEMPVCGMCGILFDSVAAQFEAVGELKHH